MKPITTTPNKPDLTRFTMNLPTELMQRIDEFASKMYLNRTAAFTVLLNNSLNTDKALGDMTELIKFINNNQEALERK